MAAQSHRRGGKVWLIILILGLALLGVGALMPLRPEPPKPNLYLIFPPTKGPPKFYTQEELDNAIPLPNVAPDEFDRIEAEQRAQREWQRKARGFAEGQIFAVLSTGFLLSLLGGFLGLVEVVVAYWPRRQRCPACGSKQSGEYCSKCGAMLWAKVPIGDISERASFPVLPPPTDRR